MLLDGIFCVHNEWPQTCLSGKSKSCSFCVLTGTLGDQKMRYCGCQLPDRKSAQWDHGETGSLRWKMALTIQVIQPTIASLPAAVAHSGRSPAGAWHSVAAVTHLLALL